MVTERQGRRRQPPRSIRQIREPMLWARLTWVILTELESRNLPGDELLARHGLTRAQLDDPDCWIPQRVHSGFVSDALDASGDATFAVEAGRRFHLDSVGVVGRAATAAASVGEALEIWSRFLGLVVEEAAVELQRTPSSDAVAFLPPPGSRLWRGAGVAFAATLIDFIRRSTGGRAGPLEISLAEPAPAAAASLEAALGAPIQWRASRPEVRFPAGTLDRPLQYASPRLKAVLLEAAEREATLRADVSAAAQVRAAILRRGQAASTSLDAVARALGTTRRSLQRRLTAEGLTFAAVRDEALQREALRLLEEDGASVAAAALRLGFASRSAFHRALKRWTGRTPGAVRRARRPG